MVDSERRRYPAKDEGRRTMHSNVIRNSILVVMMAVFLTASSVVRAEVVKFKASMDSSQEVPANDSKGKGTADLTYDTTNKELNWTITFEGLSGPATAAHFHGPAE